MLKKIHLYEKISLSLIFISLTFFIFNGYIWYFYQGAGDNATYTEITQSIHDSNKPFSYVLFSAIEYQHSKFFSGRVEEITDQMYKNPNFDNRSSYKFHLTPLQHAIAPLLYITSVENVWSFLTSLSFVGLLCIIYIVLRRKTISILNSFLFTIFLSFHPAWNHSLYGQFYIDRLFLLFGTLFVVSIHFRLSIFFTILWGLLSALIIEKIVIIFAIFSISYLFLYWTDLKWKYRVLLLTSSILFSIYGYWTVKFYLDNHYYSSFLSLQSFLNIPDIIQNPSEKLLIFLFFNLIPLVFFGVYELKLLLITLGMMVPNILGNLGGAEKTGWSTHYHTTYLPFLFVTIALGYSKMKLDLFHKDMKVFVISFYTILLCIINPYTLEINRNEIMNSSYVKTYNSNIDFYNPIGNYSQFQLIKNKLHDKIPENSNVCTHESAMVYIYQKRKICYYPIGIADADFVIINLSKFGIPKSTDNLLYNGVFSIVNKEEQDKIDLLTSKKLYEYGYNVFSPTLVINGWVVLQRGIKK